MGGCAGNSGLTAPRLLLDTDINKSQVLEEVYENQQRDITGAWVPADTPNTDLVSRAKRPRDVEAEQPHGHLGSWVVQVERALGQRLPSKPCPPLGPRPARMTLQPGGKEGRGSVCLQASSAGGLPLKDGTGSGLVQAALSSRTFWDDGNVLYPHCPRVATECLKRGIVRVTCSTLSFVSL